MYEFLTVLNGKVSFVMTLTGLVFLNNVVNCKSLILTYSTLSLFPFLYTAYQNLRVTSYDDKQNIVLGFLNIFQWLSITAFPVIVVRIIEPHLPYS